MAAQPQAAQALFIGRRGTRLTAQSVWQRLKRRSLRAGLATPVFMAHGRQDPVVPAALGERSRDALQGLGMAIQWHGYAMPHSVCADEIHDLGDWLQQRFTA